MTRRKSPQDEPWVLVEPRKPGMVHLLVVTGGLVLFGWFYFHIAGVLISTTNQDPLASDQSHNIKRALLSKQYEGLNLARRGFSYWWPHDTDGVVAPMWSRVAGMLAEDSHAPSRPGTVTAKDQELFERAKWFNVRFSFAFLCVLTLGAAWAFPGGAIGVLNLMILSGLGALLPRAVYFHPEPLYYAFFTGTWICCLLAMLGNRVWPYIAAGVFAGLAYLTKTSVQPLLIAFVAISGARFVTRIFGMGRMESKPFIWFKCVGGVVLLLAVCVALVWPRLEFSRREFGDRFHSYPTYWMWMDDFESCYEWMGKHPDRHALEQMDAEETPSPLNYWQRHTADEIKQRAAEGWLEAMERGFFPPSVNQFGWDARKPWKHLLPDRGWMLVALLGIVAAGAIVTHWRGESFDSPAQRVISRATMADRLFATVFVMLAIGGYSFAYGWYEAIGGGERFLLSLYVPLVVTLIWAGQSLVNHLPERSGWRAVYTASQLVILGLLLFRIANLVAHPVYWEAARA